jgi:TRAP-type C4-dicarboxylate transport system permease large subunit
VQDWLMMVGINILLLIVGCLMDKGSAILILRPCSSPWRCQRLRSDSFRDHHDRESRDRLSDPAGRPEPIVAMAAFRIVRADRKAALPFVAIMLAWLGIIVVYPPLVLYLVGK